MSVLGRRTATYGAEMRVDLDRNPSAFYAVAVTATSEDAARKKLLAQELDAWRKAYPERQSLDVHIVSIGRLNPTGGS